jgi:hypothetical protein
MALFRPYLSRLRRHAVISDPVNLVFHGIGDIAAVSRHLERLGWYSIPPIGRSPLYAFLGAAEIGRPPDDELQYGGFWEFFGAARWHIRLYDGGHLDEGVIVDGQPIRGAWSIGAVHQERFEVQAGPLGARPMNQWHRPTDWHAPRDAILEALQGAGLAHSWNRRRISDPMTFQEVPFDGFAGFIELHAS